MRSTVTGYWYVGRIGNDAFLPDGIWVREGEVYQWGARYAAFRRIGGRGSDRRAFLPEVGARELPRAFLLLRGAVTVLPGVGARVELPAHYDAWMRGARYGEVTRIGADGSLRVRCDNGPRGGLRVRVRREDIGFVRIVVGERADG